MSLDDGVVNENHLDDELRSQPLHVIWSTEVMRMMG